MRPDVVELTAQLLRIDTVEGGEDEALDVVAPLLEGAGFSLTRVPWRPGRSNLLATWNGGGGFVLAGHVDTVPHGSAEWAHPPLSAELDGDRLLGRGSSDMKGGVAAIVLAALAAVGPGARGFSVVLTSGEETGCAGATAVRDAGVLDPASILILGESTANGVRLGHKGVTWFEVTARGRAAHGSRPELGVNAIEALAEVVTSLTSLESGAVHPELGSRTTNVGTIAGGTQTNLVPDLAQMTVDVRTVPGSSHGPVEALLARAGEVTALLELPAVWSSPDAARTEGVTEAVARVTGRRDAPAGVSYFTDAAVLDASRSRSYIIGPGDLDQPHTTDESVSVTSLYEAVEIYGALIDAWSRGRLD